MSYARPMISVYALPACASFIFCVCYLAEKILILLKKSAKGSEKSCIFLFLQNCMPTPVIFIEETSMQAFQT
jgi:hypothetical protein